MQSGAQTPVLELALADLLVALDGVQNFEREGFFGVRDGVHFVNTIPEKPNRSILSDIFLRIH